MATPPQDEQPRRRGRPPRASAPPTAPDEPGADEQPTDEQAAVPRSVRLAEARAGQRLLREVLTGGKPLREDVSRNRALIRGVMVDFIKNELRAPTVQELVELTGLSDKTVKAHKKHIKLGDGKPNIYQQLTPDVVMSLYRKAKGFTYTAERLLTVSQGAGMGSSVERHDVEMYVQPDAGAAKLWFQIVEGLSDTTKTEHSGTVATTPAGGGFYFEYVKPEAPRHE